MKKMFGTAHWCGTYNKMPALTLSYFNGADLWVFENGKWEIKMHGDGLANLNKKIRYPLGKVKGTNLIF